jgi:hypothetical protein
MRANLQCQCRELLPSPTRREGVVAARPEGGPFNGIAVAAPAFGWLLAADCVVLS